MSSSDLVVQEHNLTQHPGDLDSQKNMALSRDEGMIRERSGQTSEATQLTMKMQDPFTNDIHSRPPRPVPFGVANSFTKQNSRVGRDESTNSRNALRQGIVQKRASLTTQEVGFLEELIINGDEIELTLARETLADESIFFHYPEKSETTDGWGEGTGIKLHTENSDASIIGRKITIENEELLKSIPLKTSQGSFTESQTSLGSAKRREHLEARKSSDLHSNMWKAHERGLAVTNCASRRSSMERNASFTRRKMQQKFNDSSVVRSTSIQDLVLQGGPTDRPGENEIFRRKKEPSLSRSNSISSEAIRDIWLSMSLNDQPGENEIFRKSMRSSLNGGNRSSINGKKSGRAAVLERPNHLRQRSSSTTQQSRRSVTFHENTKKKSESDGNHFAEGVPDQVDPAPFTKTLELKDDDLPQLPPPPPSNEKFHRQKSDSTIDTFASIRHGNALRSDSISSIPSIHHGNPIRSDSSSSFPSIHRAHPTRSDSASSIPSIRQAHPIRSTSVASSILSPASITTLSPSGKKLHFFQDEIKEEGSQSYDSSNVNPALSSPAPSKNKPNDPNKASKDSSPSFKPVLLRYASQNIDKGEGIEVSELNEEDTSMLIDTIERAREYKSMVSIGDLSAYSAISFDETISTDRLNIFRDSVNIDQSIQRSNSDDDIAAFFLGNSEGVYNQFESNSLRELRDQDDGTDSSWDMQSDDGQQQYDAWTVLKDEYAEDYGYGGPSMANPSFRILGTSADDKASLPHVLSPPLMDSLQAFLPYGISESNLWMKYSMVRDGASLHTLLQSIRGSKHTILALETSEGEVFGSFTSDTWRKNWNYYGNGESFLWKMRQNRKTGGEHTHSIIDQALLESQMDVYPWTGENDCVQLCTHNRIAVGGGAGDIRGDMTGNEIQNENSSGSDGDKPMFQEHEYGFGLSIDADLLQGTSSPCHTFGNPALSPKHADGARFEIINLEVWAITPCYSVADAEKLELGRLFLQQN